MPWTDVAEGVRNAIGDMKDEDYVSALNEGLGAASKVTGYPYEPAARLMRGWVDAVGGETDAPVRRAIGFSEYVLEE